MRRATEVCLGPTAPVDPKERPECLEEQDPSALLGLLVFLVLKESKELKVLLEELVQKEKRVYQDPLDFLAHRARLFSHYPSRGVPSPSGPSMLASCFLSTTLTCLRPTVPVLNS